MVDFKLVTLPDELKNEGTPFYLHSPYAFSKRDGGHAKDYVRGMWMMLQQETPEDFVLATGQTTTVRAFCEMAFAHLGIELRWEGEGVHEVGVLNDFNVKQFGKITKLSASDFQLSTGKALVEIDPRYFRPTEVEILLGDPDKAREKLGWQSECPVEELAKDMVESDYASLVHG